MAMRNTAMIRAVNLNTKENPATKTASAKTVKEETHGKESRRHKTNTLVQNLTKIHDILAVLPSPCPSQIPLQSFPPVSLSPIPFVASSSSSFLSPVSCQLSSLLEVSFPSAFPSISCNSIRSNSIRSNSFRNIGISSKNFVCASLNPTAG